MLLHLLQLLLRGAQMNLSFFFYHTHDVYHKLGKNQNSSFFQNEQQRRLNCVAKSTKNPDLRWAFLATWSKYLSNFGSELPLQFSPSLRTEISVLIFSSALLFHAFWFEQQLLCCQVLGKEQAVLTFKCLRVLSVWLPVGFECFVPMAPSKNHYSFL